MAKPSLTSQRKQAVAQRAAHCCEYCRCQVKYSPDPFSIEHITPRSEGGTDNLDNLALTCQGCNNRKYIQTEAYDPVSGRGSFCRGKRCLPSPTGASQGGFSITPTGRATVDKLALNREGVVNLRRVLAAVGNYPP